jgi:hypothetical protein
MTIAKHELLLHGPETPHLVSSKPEHLLLLYPKYRYTTYVKSKRTCTLSELDWAFLTLSLSSIFLPSTWLREHPFIPTTA